MNLFTALWEANNAVGRANPELMIECCLLHYLKCVHALDERNYMFISIIIVPMVVSTTPSAEDL